MFDTFLVKRPFDPFSVQFEPEVFRVCDDWIFPLNQDYGNEILMKINFCFVWKVRGGDSLSFVNSGYGPSSYMKQIYK